MTTAAAKTTKRLESDVARGLQQAAHSGRLPATVEGVRAAAGRVEQRLEAMVTWTRRQARAAAHREFTRQVGMATAQVLHNPADGIRAISAAKALTAGWIDHGSGILTAEQFQSRLNRTAVTEVYQAFNDEMAALAESLPASHAQRFQRVWVTEATGRVCHECGPMSGKTATLRGSFEGGVEPGFMHPNCRCVSVIEAT